MRLGFVTLQNFKIKNTAMMILILRIILPVENYIALTELLLNRVGVEELLNSRDTATYRHSLT